jgi:hypothetical protein
LGRVAHNNALYVKWCDCTYNYMIYNDSLVKLLEFPDFGLRHSRVYWIAARKFKIKNSGDFFDVALDCKKQQNYKSKIP